jgi:unsaturated rhamnogalacturonyl hydrolase
MPAEDEDNALLAAPPRPPVAVDAVTLPALAQRAHEVGAATWRLGLRRWFWGEGVCLVGLVRCGLAFDSAIPGAVRAWYDEHLLDAGFDPTATLDHVNELAPGTAALLLGDHDEQARAAYRPALQRLRRWADSASVTYSPQGAVEHWPGGVWADTMYMAGVFLLRWGASTGELTATRAGVEQVLAHCRELQQENGLFVHGSHAGQVVPCFWGRANAWAALAIVEALEAVGDDPAFAGQATSLRQSLTRQVHALAALQPEHGVWDVLVDGQVENRGILETSAAAGLAAAMLRAAPLLDGEADLLSRTGWRALQGALAYCDGGVLTRVSAGTVLQLVPFGYSVIRDDRPQPWGQGLLLQALAAAGEALARGEVPR